MPKGEVIEPNTSVGPTTSKTMSRSEDTSCDVLRLEFEDVSAEALGLALGTLVAANDPALDSAFEAAEIIPGCSNPDGTCKV